MSKGTAGSFFGIAKAGVNLIPIFRENELKKHPNSFLKRSALIIKKNSNRSTIRDSISAQWS